VSFVARFLAPVTGKRTRPGLFSNPPAEIILDLENDTNAELFRKFKEGISRAPKELHVELVGVGHPSPDISLAIWDLVQASKECGLRVSTWARSSLYDAGLLLWLLGDKRRIRRNTGFFLISCIDRLDQEDWGTWKSDTPHMIFSEPGWVSNYREVFRLMNQFIPARELADKRQKMEVLGEYGLLDGQGDHWCSHLKL
jgi:hypothetical protein